MLQQRFNNRAGIKGNFWIEAGLQIVRITGPNQLQGISAQQREQPLKRFPVKGMLQIINDVELDAAFAQDFQCAARFSSGLVVIDNDPAHAHDSPVAIKGRIRRHRMNGPADSQRRKYRSDGKQSVRWRSAFHVNLSAR